MYSAQICAPYSKNGDDFDNMLRNSDSTKEALIKWAASLEDAAADLRRIAAIVSELPDVEGYGDTHYAALHNLTEEVRDKLLDESLVWDHSDDEDLAEDELDSDGVLGFNEDLDDESIDD